VKASTHTHDGNGLDECPGQAVQGRLGPDLSGDSSEKPIAEAPRWPRFAEKTISMVLGILGFLGASAMGSSLELVESIGKQVGSIALRASWNC